MPVVEIPLATSQNVSGHPFFFGSSAQTSRSSNLWVDGRGRLRRRPALHVYGDTVLNPERITGIFNYKFRAKWSKSLSLMAAYLDNIGDTSASTYTPGVYEVSGKDFGFPTVSTYAVDTRFSFRDVATFHTPAKSFDPFEQILIYKDSTSSSNGTLVTAAQMVVDNLNYDAGTPLGNIVVRNTGVSALTTAPGTYFRVLGSTTASNVSFSTLKSGRLHKNLWAANSLSDFTPYSVPDFAQYGRLMFIADNSGRYPIRAWQGGYSVAGVIKGAPSGSYLSVHQNRVWVGGIPSDGSAIVGCGLDFNGFPNPYDWDYEDIRPNGAVYLPIGSDDQDAITGMSRSHFGTLIVFKNGSTYRVQGAIYNDLNTEVAQPFEVTTISRTIGCAAHRTIHHVNNDVMWMSSRGVHSLMATDKYGDVEQAYLSYPISDIWANINVDRLEMCQAVWQPRLGLYLLGIVESGYDWMSKLLAYSPAEQRWMIWDIGQFSAIGVGPSRSGDTDSIYVALVTSTGNKMAILNFDDQTDWDQTFIGGDDLGSSTGISVVIEPGDIFSRAPEERFNVKSIDRIQIYMSPVGNFTSSMIYMWDGGDERTVTLNLNPDKEKAFGTGWTLGDLFAGNVLGSKDYTTVTSVPIKGQGHTLRIRIEDSNVGRLPYLGMDAMVVEHDADYSPATRKN